ncbi:MAG: ribonuclease catalytic domain-containing protein [Gammaproteobacteria bacterium]
MTMQRNPQHCNQHEMLGELAHQAMIDKGLEPDFAPAVDQQLETINAPASESDPSIKDLRSLLWCSIDNDDSRDLDQLTVAEDLGGGNVRAIVAVADVDAIVRKGTPIDDHARHNTTSVYTPAQIFPMLPPKLSFDLTSLNQDQDRIAVVIDMVVASDGSVTKGDVYRGLVHNRAKLAYNKVGAWLDGSGPNPWPS